MNNEDIMFVMELTAKAKTQLGVKEIVYDKNLMLRMIELHDKYGKKSLFKTIDEVREGKYD